MSLWTCVSIVPPAAREEADKAAARIPFVMCSLDIMGDNVVAKQRVRSNQFASMDTLSSLLAHLTDRRRFS